MDRSLGDGGMPLLGQLGVDFERYGEGWVEATWTPTELAGNPFGPVHGGVYGVVHDAAMNFATNSALDVGRPRRHPRRLVPDPSRAPRSATSLAVRGEVVQLTRQVAYAESTVTDGEGRVVSRAMATFIVRRKSAVTESVTRARDPRRTRDAGTGATHEAHPPRVDHRGARGRRHLPALRHAARPGRRRERRRLPHTRSRSSTPRSSSASTTSTRSSRRSSASTGSCRSGTSSTAPSTS